MEFMALPRGSALMRKHYRKAKQKGDAQINENDTFISSLFEFSDGDGQMPFEEGGFHSEETMNNGNELGEFIAEQGNSISTLNADLVFRKSTRIQEYQSNFIINICF